MSAHGPQAGGAPDEATEEQLRAAYEQELSRVSTTDVIAQTAVSLLNVAARRLAPPAQGPAGDAGPSASERDLEQARDAIDAVRALLEILERRIPQELGPLRDALSRLQMAYAQEIAPGAPGGAGTGDPGADPQSPGAGAPHRQGPDGHSPGGEGADPARPGESSPPPGPAQSSGRLWVPGQ